MWHDFSIRYIKHNRTTSIFLALIAFTSATLLSLISSVFYNMWVDQVNQKILMHGSAPQTLEPIVIAYLFVLVVVCIALISMIHNAFEVSMNARLHQLGILQSVGATPKQIRTFLIHEAFVLCLLPILLGVIVGFGLSYAFMELIIQVTEPVRRYEVIFRYNLVTPMMTLILSALTLGISAWIPARKISRLTPLAAIHYGNEPPVDKMKRFRIFSTLFGAEGELARKSLYARRRSLRTATRSLALSFLAFVSFLNLETISGLSTQLTYFDRYQDTWDFLITADGDYDPNLLSDIRSMPEITAATAYKRTSAYTVISPDQLSAEVVQLGGLESLTSTIKAGEDERYTVTVPILVLDEASFATYQEQQQAKGAVILVNTVWDSLHSNRLNRAYIPYLDEQLTIDLELSDAPTAGTTLPITITDYADQIPQLKESFGQFTLLLVVSEAFYHDHLSMFVYDDSVINILTQSDDVADAVYAQLEAQLTDYSDYILEGRLLERQSDVSMRNTLKLVIGSLAGLLTCIGLANVFSNTLGQIHQRKREFARYFSIGLSPAGMRKILLLEVVIITLRPVLLSLFLNVPVILLALSASSIPMADFIQNMPILPISLFLIMIMVTVGVAYSIGGQRLSKHDIIETLKDETMI